MPNTKEKQTLEDLIKSCLSGNRSSQRLLYKQFYGYGMSICIRYAKNKEEAQEVFNDGFVKAFKHLHKFDFKKPFKFWLRRILINTAIDYLRKNKKHHETIDIEQAYDVKTDQLSGLDNLSAQDLLKLVQQLAPSYRAVFNLYAIEGYTHKEIAQRMNISEGTSKSNLAYARRRLKQMLSKINKQVNEYGK